MKQKGGKIPKHNNDFFVFNGNYSIIYNNHWIYKSEFENQIDLNN